MNENEKTTALILYDLTGRVWGVYSGETKVPQGQLGFIAEVEDRPIISVELDMTTTPPTPHLVYGRVWEDVDKDASDIQLALIELDERISALEE